MKHLKIFIELTRLNKPIGFMLLFWPCSWGLAYAYSLNNNIDLLIFYLLLFFLGSVLMRSAGCVFNDIVDKDFDIKVRRTKKRPIASGKISVKLSLIYVLSLCFFAFLILIQFNYLTIFLGMSSMVLAFAYPYMKRITYWPQLFLGLTFNWGIIMAWSAFNNDISLNICFLYLSAIFWTLGYDTIYGIQDMSDDEIIGLKSTAINFKENLGLNFFTFLIFLFGASLFFQILKLKVNNSENCLKMFKVNNLSGLILFLAIVFIRY